MIVGVFTLSLYVSHMYDSLGSYARDMKEHHVHITYGYNYFLDLNFCLSLSGVVNGKGKPYFVYLVDCVFFFR